MQSDMVWALKIEGTSAIFSDDLKTYLSDHDIFFQRGRWGANVHLLLVAINMRVAKNGNGEKRFSVKPIFGCWSNLIFKKKHFSQTSVMTI